MLHRYAPSGAMSAVGQIQLSRPAPGDCPGASAYPRGPDPVCCSSAHLWSVPHPDMGCSLALQRVKGCGTPEVNIGLGNWLAMQEACLLETKAAD